MSTERALDTAQRDGKQVRRRRVYSDISPESVLLDFLEIHTRALRAGAELEYYPLRHNWRKRLSHREE
jgi:hypothetical protein